jgi:hypothetical protein
MDKNQVLENIKATQARLAAVIKEGYPQVYTIVERVEALDLRPFIDEVTENLTEAFDYWAKGMEPGCAVGCVHFEYSYTKDDEVYAYGYADAAIEPASSEKLKGFVEINCGEDVFYDSPGFKAFSFWEKTEGLDEETEGSDYETVKMAEIFFHAMEKAVLSDAFVKLPKADEVTFALCRHDRWEIIGYVWKK